MNYTLPTNIGTEHLRKLMTCKHAGYLHQFVEKFFFRTKWHQKYIVICKGNKCTWNMCCYENAFAYKADINYSMLEFESVKEYDNADANIIGFTMKFEEPTRRALVFRCDTTESRNNWIEQVHSAIQDAHKDSGYSSDTDRQSKKYETIDDVENGMSGKLHIADRETEELNNTGELNETGELNTADELRNTSRKFGSWLMKTEITTSADYKDTGLDDTDDCYENIRAENKTFTGNACCQRKHGTVTDCKQRNVDETYVKDMISHPDQETDVDTRIGEPSRKSHQKHKPKEKCTAKKYHQQPAEQPPELVIETDHVYENMAHGMVQMDNLKLDFPPEDENGVDHSLTDEKAIHPEEMALPECIRHDANKDKVICELKLMFGNRHGGSLIGKGFIKALIKSDTSVVKGSTSPPDSKSLPDSPVPKQSPPYTQSKVSTEDNTVLKLPVSSPSVSSSFMTVHGCSEDSHAIESESFASVTGTNDSATVQSPVRKTNIHSKSCLSDSLTFAKECHTCSSLTRAKTFSDERRETSASECSTNTCLQEKKIHSVSEDTASFASVREDATCAPETSESSKVKTEKDTNMPLHKSAACTILTDDDEVTYENTDTGYIAANNYGRQDSEISRSSKSSNLHSTSSSSSFSSRDSNASLRTYESPDEGAHYENIKFFQKEEYECSKKSNVKRMMKNKSIGTFLVRPGDPCMEMCVMTTDGVKYFRIYKQEDKLSLFKDFSNSEFVLPDLDNLLFYYHINYLPSRDYKVKLEKGYKAYEKDNE